VETVGQARVGASQSSRGSQSYAFDWIQADEADEASQAQRLKARSRPLAASALFLFQTFAQVLSARL
jgi:hypothetical protein